ncbi:OpgC domain-containing protein [Arthrobacter sp. P2b]|uniref:OpgC domain-containing protein n=1 Tax=Arthrobacter sp. P2b TaxID=1938741 RepID=UPI001116FF03|nr:OpgC domain-containing protein [Arthrobacter sp. P2b]
MNQVNRIAAFDALRGLCIVSMVVHHASSGSLLDKMTHAYRWVDGAVGFVLLAGVLIGMIQRRAIATKSLQAGARLLRRRSRQLYVYHLVLTFAALCAGAYAVGHPLLPQVVNEQGWLIAVGGALILSVNAMNADLLSVYAVLIFCTQAITPLLARGRTWAVFCISASIYVVALIMPQQFTLPAAPGELGYFNLGAWQALYVVGLLAGWHWTSKAVRKVFDSRAALIASVMLLCLGGLLRVLEVEGPAIDFLLGKFSLGPASLVLAFALFIFLTRFLTKLITSRAGWLISPLCILGRNSLAAYLTLAFWFLAATAFQAYDPASVTGMFASAAVLLVILLWGIFQTSAIRRKHKQQKTPSAPRQS